MYVCPVCVANDEPTPTMMYRKDSMCQRCFQKGKDRIKASAARRLVNENTGRAEDG